MCNDAGTTKHSKGIFTLVKKVSKINSEINQEKVWSLSFSPTKYIKTHVCTYVCM